MLNSQGFSSLPPFDPALLTEVLILGGFLASSNNQMTSRLSSVEQPGWRVVSLPGPPTSPRIVLLKGDSLGLLGAGDFSPSLMNGMGNVGLIFVWCFFFLTLQFVGQCTESLITPGPRPAPLLLQVPYLDHVSPLSWVCSYPLLGVGGSVSLPCYTWVSDDVLMLQRAFNLYHWSVNCPFLSWSHCDALSLLVS